MAPKTWAFKTRTGHSLHAVVYPAKSPLKAVVVYNHGIAEHCGRYDQVFESMADAGIEARSFDMRCFGQSEKDEAKRGDIESFTTLVDDLEDFCKDAAGAHTSGSVPLFLAGGSLGGLVAAHTALRDQTILRGLLFLSPAFDVEWTTMLRVQAAIGSLLAAAVPKAKLMPAVQLEHLCPDVAVQDAYAADPLVMHGNARCRMGNEALNAMGSLKKRYADLTLPIYGTHGDADKVTSLAAHQRFVDAVSSTDKTLKVVPDGYHELLQGPEKGDVTAALIDWMLQRCTNAAPPAVARM